MGAVRTTMVVLALLVPGMAHADIVINELLPNPAGTDTGKEYVELYNNGDSEEDLSGWTLEAGTRSFSVKVTLPEGTRLAPGGFLVVGESQVSEADIITGALLLGNAGSSGDAVRLKHVSGRVLDTVVYGPNNSDGFLDDAGGTAVPGPKPADDRALGRAADGVDTDDASADFELQTPTPGAPNPRVEPVSCDSADQALGLVINEILVDPEGTDDGAEWVELYNGSDATLDLSDYVLQAETRTFDGSGTRLPKESFMPPGAYWVVGGESVAERTLPLQGSLPNASSNADAIQLIDCDGGIVDTVIYGGSNEDGWVDDGGDTATSIAPKATNGATVARAFDGVDTDQSGVDFVVQAAEAATPGRANPEPPPCDAGANLVINEFMADPAEDDATHEWVELYNAGDESISLAGWFLGAGTSSVSSGTELDDVQLAAGGYYLIGKEGVEGADALLKSGLGNAGSSSDALQLRDCLDAVIDTVVYGGPNTDGFIDDTGEVASSLAPSPASGASLSRLQDGYDNDASRTDFAVETEPTPGAANTPREAIVCTPATGDTVVLNEILVNPEGEDDGYEWIELYNPTSEPVRVDGWGISAAGKADQIGIIEASLPGGVVVPAGGYLVFGGESVESVDVVVPLELGNGSDGDAVILYDCEDQRVDSVLYGSSNADGMTDDSGQVPEMAFVTDPGSGETLARIEDGVDSDGGDDWFVDGSPTPGSTNVQSGTEGPEPGGGCGNRNDPDEPGSGCGRGDAPPAVAGLLILLAGLGRRRRR